MQKCILNEFSVIGPKLLTVNHEILPSTLGVLWCPRNRCRLVHVLSKRYGTGPQGQGF